MLNKSLTLIQFKIQINESLLITVNLLITKKSFKFLVGMSKFINLYTNALLTFKI
jgi:hypothetical protein